MVVWAGWKRITFLALALSVASLLVLEGVFQERNRQVMNFKPISGPIENPLMGLAPWATIWQSQQPHTLVYADLTWRDFEPEQGVFDFDAFEKRNQLARWRAENKRVVFRFVCDRPGKVAHLDIPDWLYEATGGSGERYENEYGKGFSPNYANPIFIQNHQKAIQALGERYGQDGFFAFVELGSLGHWGEWHVHYPSGIRRLPPEDIRDQYVQHYIEAFPNTFLMMRRPFNIAKERNLGLYNDMMGDLKSTRIWLEWIANGGGYEQTKEMDALSAMPNGWRTAPIGGEQTISLSHERLYGTAIEQTIQLHQESHTTFIGPHGPYDVAPGGPLQAGIDRVLETIGYRLYIRQVRMPFWVIYNKKLPVTLTFANEGIAPMYYNWPVEVYLLDENGQIRKKYRPEIDLREIQPGVRYTVSFDIPLERIAGGKYRLGLAILDPLTGQPAVRLAMPNPRADRIQELGQFQVIDLRRLLPQ